MLSDTHRTCPQCKSDEDVRHVCTRLNGITFQCQTCKREWTVPFASDPRPVFDARPQAA